MTSKILENTRSKHERFRRYHISSSSLALTLAMGSVAIGSVVAPAAAAETEWSGAVSQDWFDGSNWNNGAPPTAAVDAVINTTAPNPATINANAVAAGVYIGTTVGAPGALAISGGGTLSSTNAIVGNGLASGVTIDGTGSAWTNSTTLTVGSSGIGTLMISNGGVATNTTGTLGNGIGSTGSATVINFNSAWNNSSDFYVGNYGEGVLLIANGGAVSNDSGYVGKEAGSKGMVAVDGAFSTWTSSKDLVVGLNGAGTLTVSNGGTVSSTNGTIGGSSDGTGTVTVTGAGSTWTNSTSLAVGDAGVGTVNILNGGAVSSNNGYVGAQAGSTGTATVTGVGSTWTNSADLTVGLGGTGALAISNGGVVSNSNGIVGRASGSTGSVTVTGVGSSWTNSLELQVGGEGTGALTISNGGVVSSNFGYVGLDAGSTGSVTVTGVGSTWTSGMALNVGYDGTGALTIAAGGTVTADSGKLGLFAGGTGTVIVDGAGSTLTYANDFVLGFSGGTGVLTIQNGGKVANQDGTLGSQPGSIGTAHVAGAGSTWTNTGNLVVGHHATGTLVISSGGVVTSASGQVGRFDDAIGTATVDGAGSTWTNSGDLTVGGGGPGTLTIANDGVVSVGGAFVLAGDAGSIGTLNIGSAAGSPATGAGTLNAASVQFGSGTGAINFNHTATNYVFAPVINGLGTINQIAGNTNLTADSSGFIGATHVSGGRLAVNGSLANSVATVSGGGMLGGNGTVGGILAQAGGIVAPGNSIGTLNVAGNVAFAAGSAYQVEVNAAGQSDKIVASGTATLNGGAVVVQNASGSHVLGSHYTILTAAGGVTGAFAGASATSATPFLSFGLTYDPSNVYLDVSRSNVSFASVGGTPNQIATGGGVDSLGIDGPLVDVLVQLDLPQARAAFDQLSGEVHASAKGVMIEDSRFLRDAVNNRLRAAFEGVASPSMPVIAYGPDGPELAADPGAPAAWGQAFGSWGTMDGDGNAATIKRGVGGFFTGGDALIAETWRVGLVGGYSRSTFDVDERDASGSSDNYHVGLYGGTQLGNLALRSGLAYSWHDIAMSRSVAFSSFNDLLKGDYRAGTTQAFGELGYRINAWQASFEPFANLAYASLATRGFTETGGAAALTTRSSTDGVTFTTLGLRAATGFTVGNGMNMTARGMLGWQHAFGDTTPVSTMAFSGGSPFSIGGVPIARDAAVVDVGLDLNLTPNATLGLAYGGQFGNGATDQMVRGNFNVKF